MIWVGRVEGTKELQRDGLCGRRNEVGRGRFIHPLQSETNNVNNFDNFSGCGGSPCSYDTLFNERKV